MADYKAGLILKDWREQTLMMKRPEFVKTYGLLAKGWDEYYLANHETGKVLLSMDLLNHIRERAAMPDEVYQEITKARDEDKKNQFKKNGDEAKEPPATKVLPPTVEPSPAEPKVVEPEIIPTPVIEPVVKPKREPEPKKSRLKFSWPKMPKKIRLEFSWQKLWLAIIRQPAKRNGTDGKILIAAMLILVTISTFYLGADRTGILAVIGYVLCLLIAIRVLPRLSVARIGLLALGLTAGVILGLYIFLHPS